MLFELVGDPKALTAPCATRRGAARNRDGRQRDQHASSRRLGKYLELTFQLDAIDYTGKNMVHADTTAEEFEQMQKERGETMMTLFARAMEVQ